MTLNEILDIIHYTHKEGDPESFNGLVDICRDISYELDMGDFTLEFWSEEAMVAIAQAAFEAGRNY